MNTPEIHDPITRWRDGAMTPAELATFEAELQNNPTLRAEAAAVKELGDLLRRHVTLEAPVPHADFFNSQIQEQITSLRRVEIHAKRTPALLSALSWLMRRWAIASAMAVVGIGIFAWSSLNQGDESSQVLGFYAPDAGVQASSYQNSDANAAVVVLDGLAAIPDDQSISGSDSHQPDTSPPVKNPKTSDVTLPGAGGEALLAMAAR